MNILVCVHALKGESGNVPFRSSALDGAIQTAERIPDLRITAVAMEDFDGAELLRSSRALGAAKALLLQGHGPSPYDCVGLGAMLAEAVRTAEGEPGPVDAVFCGDSDLGQDGLGPALAGYLGWPQVTGVSKVEADGAGLKVWRNWEGECALLQVETPCVLSFLPSEDPASYPQLSRLMAANQAELPSRKIQTASDLRQSLAFRPRPREKRISYGAVWEDVESVVKALADDHMI